MLSTAHFGPWCTVPGLQSGGEGVFPPFFPFPLLCPPSTPKLGFESKFGHMYCRLESTMGSETYDGCLVVAPELLLVSSSICQGFLLWGWGAQVIEELGWRSTCSNRALQEPGWWRTVSCTGLLTTPEVVSRAKLSLPAWSWGSFGEVFLESHSHQD